MKIDWKWRLAPMALFAGYLACTAVGCEACVRPCRVNSDCLAEDGGANRHFCADDRFCRSECKQDPDCPSGCSCTDQGRCTGDAGSCGPPASDAGAVVGRPCLIHTDCGGGAFCSEGKCKIECRAPRDCPAGCSCDFLAGRCLGPTSGNCTALEDAGADASTDAGTDGGPGDAGAPDGGRDGGPDAGVPDAGPPDGGTTDGGAADGGSDAGLDAGTDAGTDGGLGGDQ